MCISTHTTKKTWQIDVVDRQIYSCVWYFCIYLYGLSLNGWHAVCCITNNCHDVTITTHAIKRHFLIWMTTVRQPTKRRRSCVLTLKYTFICVYWWTEPRLESFYPPFVAGHDLPHQGVVDSYNLNNGISYTGKVSSLYWIGAQTGIMQHMAQSHIKKQRNLTTAKLHISKKNNTVTHQESTIAS